MENRKDVLLKLNALAECFDKDLSEEAQLMYMNVLSEFTYEQILKAFNHVGRTCKWFPKPAEIIEAIEGGKDVKALSAWDQVITDIRKKGRLQGGKFDDPAITQAVRICGGWEKICDTEEKNMQFVKKDFVEAFGVVEHDAFRPAIGMQKVVGVLTKGIGDC